MARGFSKLERLAIRSNKRVSHRVESQRTSKDHGGDEVGRGDKGVSGWVGIVASGKVAVVRSDN